jgi:hypothetical protein
VLEPASGQCDVDWCQVIKTVHMAATFYRALGFVGLFGGEPAIGTACQSMVSDTSTKGALTILTGSNA